MSKQMKPAKPIMIIIYIYIFMYNNHSQYHSYIMTHLTTVSYLDFTPWCWIGSPAPEAELWGAACRLSNAKVHCLCTVKLDETRTYQKKDLLSKARFRNLRLAPQTHSRHWHWSRKRFVLILESTHQIQFHSQKITEISEDLLFVSYCFV